MSSRIVVILHPNTSRIDFTINDRMFNREKYCFNREVEAVGPEAAMLDVLNTCTNGIVKAEASRNSMSLEIEDGFYLSEVVPPVITAIKEFVGEKDYTPIVYVDDRRWKKEPVTVDSGDDWMPERVIEQGSKYSPGEANIGVQYVPWED
ncbi:hypothetical protein D3C87_325050 [compost metagenome]